MNTSAARNIFGCDRLLVIPGAGAASENELSPKQAAKERSEEANRKDRCDGSDTGGGRRSSSVGMSPGTAGANSICDDGWTLFHTYTENGYNSTAWAMLETLRLNDCY